MAPSLTLVSDLDHTMVQNEDVTHRRLLAFNHVWTTHCQSRDSNLLVFSTGRSPHLFNELWQAAPLLTPDVLICSVGTEIFYNASSPVAQLLSPNSAGAASAPCWVRFLPDKVWEGRLSEGWSRATVEEVVERCCPELVKQADSEQRPHKISYTLTPPSSQSHGGPAPSDTVVQRLRAELEAQGLQAKVIFSGGRDLDMLAAGAGKGCALACLLQQLKEAGFSTDIVLANGDSGNDAELMEVEGVMGCMVGNAYEELRQRVRRMVEEGARHILQARNPCAGGIVEAMLQFGALPAHSPALCQYSTLLHLPTDAQPAGPTGTAADPLCAHQHEDGGTPHGSDTNAIPASAHPAPGAPGGTVIEGPAQDIPESDPAITTAAMNVGRGAVTSEPCGPDSLAQGQQPQQPAQDRKEERAAHSNALQGSSLSGLSPDEGAREWVWQVGSALAQELVRGWLPDAGMHSLPPHSSLRLVVTNDCTLSLEPPATSSVSETAGETGDEEAVELADDLVPEGVVEAAAHDPASVVGRTWVDQLRLDMGQSGAVPEGEEAAGGADRAIQFTAEFFVCTLTPSGLRSPTCWHCCVEAASQPEPVPQGFLAHRITVASQQIDLPTCLQFESV